MESNWIKQLYNIPVWKKYSQSGEESYVTHILGSIKPKDKIIVELGAWDGYHLSNTRFLIEQGYSAFLVDGDNRGNSEVKEYYVTKENVNEIFGILGVPASFDFLNIDLDGNDYYILDEILKSYNPSLIVAEFNPIFRTDQACAIAYNPDHVWQENDYYGFSFAAGLKLAEKHQYTCIFQNADLNMYFVCNKVLAESLGVDINEIQNHVPPVTYNVQHYHPASGRTDWVNV